MTCLGNRRPAEGSATQPKYVKLALPGHNAVGVWIWLDVVPETVTTVVDVEVTMEGSTFEMDVEVELTEERVVVVETEVEVPVLMETADELTELKTLPGLESLEAWEVHGPSEGDVAIVDLVSFRAGLSRCQRRRS